MDALSLAGPARDVTVVGGGKSELDAYLAAALAEVGRVGDARRLAAGGLLLPLRPFQPRQARRADVLRRQRRRTWSTGGRAAGEACEAAYRDNAYHGPDDEYDPNWNWAGTLQDLQLFYRLGRMLGETERLAELVPERRIPPHPRRELRRAGRLLSACRAAHAGRMGPQDWMWIGFPHDADRVARRSSLPAQEQIAAFANAVAESGQQVRLVVRDAANEARARAAGQRRGDARAARLRRHLAARHRAAGACSTATGERFARRFGFNGWGGKYADGRRPDDRRRRWPSDAGLPVATSRLDPRRRRDRHRRHRPGRHHRAMPAQSQPQSRAVARARSKRGCATISASSGCCGSATACSTTTPTAMSTTSRASSRRARWRCRCASGPDDPNAAIYADAARAGARLRRRRCATCLRRAGSSEAEIVEPASYMNFAICNDAGRGADLRLAPRRRGGRGDRRSCSPAARRSACPPMRC